MLAGRTVGLLCTQRGLAVVSSETQEGENPLIACDSLETPPPQDLGERKVWR